MKDVRTRSIEHARRLGYVVDRGLPALGVHAKLRSDTELARRMLCLTAVVAAALGFPRARSIDWLHQEGLYGNLSRMEVQFLAGAETNVDMRFRVECIWALAWCAQLISVLDFAVPCADTLITYLPDLKRGEPSASFIQKVECRDVEAIYAQCDLAFCLHWAIQDARLHGRKPPGALHPIYVVERRRALEWMLSEDGWDDIPLDT